MLPRLLPSTTISVALGLALAACMTTTSPRPATSGPTPAPTTPVSTTPADPAGAAEERFTGTLTEVRFGCAVDASCDLVVDGTKHVHFGHDTRLSGPTAWGDTESLWPLMERPDKGVGTRVEVFAAKVDATHYTLQGKESYYVKVLP